MAKARRYSVSLTLEQLNLVEDGVYALIHYIDHGGDEGWLDTGPIAHKLYDRLRELRQHAEELEPIG